MNFNKAFNTIIGKCLTLRLIETYHGDDKIIPFYYYDIYLNQIDKPIGKISIRIGHNQHSYYNGNIGYEVDEPYRGHGYAAQAVKMVLDVARFHQMSELIIACSEDNFPSRRVIEKLKATHLDTLVPPPSYVFYYEGMKAKSIYRLDL